jgi:hypothetical protein
MTPEAGAPKSDAANEYYGRQRAFTDLYGRKILGAHGGHASPLAVACLHDTRPTAAHGYPGQCVAGVRELLGSG